MLPGESAVAYVARICGLCGWRLVQTPKVRIETVSVAKITVAEFADLPQAAEFLAQVEALQTPHLPTSK